ncbi:DNA primase [bacterium]|nr:DNA primase [bacterium]
MDLRDRVLERVDLVELIGQYTALTRKGREWVGRCPFHNEKTGSFYVNAEKGVYKCFGCGAGGGAIQFIMSREGLEFRDALETLARRYNIAIEEQRPGPGGFSARGEKERLYELNEAAARFFRQQLRGPAGALARDYLQGRGIGDAALTDFDLGYAPKEWGALTDLLLGQGATAADLVKLGLIKSRDKSAEGGPAGQGFYDTFRHRLIFPIRAVTGRIIAFAGRALSAEDNPKYLNVSNTPLYDKSRTLYNLDRAKGVLREEGCVIVEGYMDVIGLAQAGVRNAVASCGTALTGEHVTLLQKYAEHFYLAFDSDEAGLRAAWAAGMLFLSAGYSPRVVPISGGKDPDEIARGEGGRERWLGLLAEAEDNSVLRFWLQQQRRANPRADSAALRRWVSELAGLYRGLPDELIRQEAVQDIAGALNLGAQEVRALLHSSPGPAQHRSPLRQDSGQSAARDYGQLKAETQQRAMLLGASVIEREVIRRLCESEQFSFVCRAMAQGAWFEDNSLRELFELLALESSGPQELMHDPRWSGLLAELHMSEGLADTDELLLARFRNQYLEREIQRLTGLFQRASARQDEEEERSLLSEILRLKSQIRDIRGLGGQR